MSPPDFRNNLRHRELKTAANPRHLVRLALEKVPSAFAHAALDAGSAVLMEVTEDWETGRRYLSMDAEQFV